MAPGGGALWGGPRCPGAGISRTSPHSQGHRDTGTRDQARSGKTDYVPLGLHPVPRGGNWVHPKNNQTRKQLRHANGFRIYRPHSLKVQLSSHCPSPFSRSREGPRGDLGSSGVTVFRHPSGGLTGFLPSPGTPPAPGHPSVAGVRPPRLRGPECP